MRTMRRSTVIFLLAVVALLFAGLSLSGTGITVPTSFTSLLAGTSTGKAFVMGAGSSLSPSGGSILASAFAANPSDCSTEGFFAIGIGASGDAACESELYMIPLVIDGRGAEIPMGDIEQIFVANFFCNINRIDVSGTPSGSITVDIWNAAGAIPTSGDKISASAPATLSSSRLNLNGSLAAWTTGVSPGNVISGSVVTVSTVEYVTIQMWCKLESEP